MNQRGKLTAAALVNTSTAEELTRILGDWGELETPWKVANCIVRARAAAPIVLWSVDPEDWSDRDTARQVAVITEAARDGDIILLHDIYPSSVDTALQVVDTLMARGFHFVTVEQLFAIRGQTPENGKVYRRLPPAD